MNELKILSKVKWLMDYFDNQVFNLIPKSLVATRFKIEENIFALIENTIKANINTGNIRSKYQKEVLFNISMIDFYVGYILDKKVFKKRRFSSIVNVLEEIRKMTYGWINSESGR